RGTNGLNRVELLNYLRSIALALDELYNRHQVQHLALSPRNLALLNDQPLMLEFGLAELFWLPAGIQPALINPRYSASELFDGLASDSCDQVSLALIFAEMITGLHPFRNLNARQMASPRLRGQPDLSLLQGGDRAILQQALSAEPDRRFRSCSDLI